MALLKAVNEGVTKRLAEIITHEYVPHLFPDLPDELLPALSKFLFVGKDEAEQGTIELSSVQDMTQVWFLTQLAHYSVVLDGVLGPCYECVLVSLYSKCNARVVSVKTLTF